MSDALGALSSGSIDPNLLVGFDTSDDAAVYKLTDELAVISTVDFITPPVDDPVWFGRIAAANSLSDVYAMGGHPVMALNVIMFPSDTLDMGIMKAILEGGLEKVNEAGASMAGGHSVEDEEPKYGLSVTGIVHPDRIMRNSGAQAGDVLVLTKPIGSGVLFNARRSGKLTDRDLEPVLHMVATLNKAALDVVADYEIHACTDITGFGLSGHAIEMARGSNVDITMEYAKIPFYADSLAMYKKKETTRSNTQNRQITEGYMQIRAGLDHYEEELLFDPQTSGGLLFAIPEYDSEVFLADLKKAGVESASILGRCSAPSRKTPSLIIV